MKNKTSVNSVSLPQLSVDAELINMLYEQANTALFGVIATATGIAIVFFNESPITTSFWLSAIYILSFSRYVSINKFKSLENKTENVLRWGWLLAFFVFLSGLTWGAASIIFFTPDNLQLFNILTLIIITLSIGSLAVLSAYPNAYYFFVMPAMLPMIWQYLNIDESFYRVFGLLLIVFYASLFSILRVNHRILRDSIVLRFENVNLIEQLIEQKEKAEQANISKTKFLAAASHDIRQPIHAIGLFLGLLEERVEKNDQKIIVHKIKKSSEALNNLLDSLLDISKLDAGVIQTDIKGFCINDVFEALKTEFKTCADEKNITIKFIKTKLCINSDRKIIDRILRNLISNAIRYTHKGGVVVGCRRYQGDILLAVYDTGIGIDKNELATVFDEFHQLHNPERDGSKGLGLGLAIVKRMAELLALRLYIKSIPEQGSVFGVIVSPLLSQSMLAEPTVNEKSKPLFFDGQCILVVDDEASIRDSLNYLLASWHADVIVAASGDDAINQLNKNQRRPDIILADYRLANNETGVDVIKKVNALYPNEKIMAIIITGDTAPKRIKQAESSAYKIIHKPVSPTELRLQLAEKLLNLKE